MKSFNGTERSMVATRARNTIGWPYKIGGESTAGIDCSGDVLYAWEKYLPDLPHHAADLALQTDVATIVPAGRRLFRRWPHRYLKVGDWVFYYGSLALPESISHVAVYLGGGMIANATGVIDGVNRGVELIKLRQYAQPTAYGFVGHKGSLAA